MVLGLNVIMGLILVVVNIVFRVGTAHFSVEVMGENAIGPCEDRDSGSCGCSEFGSSLSTDLSKV